MLRLRLLAVAASVPGTWRTESICPGEMAACSVESSVVQFPIGAVWEAVRTLKFEWCAALSGDGVAPSGKCWLAIAKICRG